MNIIGRKNIYFAISLLVIIPGLISLLLYGLNLSIDFTGGSRMTMVSNVTLSNKTLSNVKNVFVRNGVKVASFQSTQKTLSVRTVPLDQKLHAKLLADISKVGKLK